MSPPHGSPRAGRLAIAVALSFALVGAALFVSAYRMDRRWIEVHMTPHSCAEHPPELSRGNMIRWAGFLGGGLLLVLAPRAGRWAGRRTSRGVAGTALRIVIAVALALVPSHLVRR